MRTRFPLSGAAVVSLLLIPLVLACVTFNLGMPASYKNSGGIEPVWSPDGRQIAFGTNAGKGGKQDMQVCVLDVDTPGKGVCITRGDYPTWSPDGSKIAFENYGFFVISSDGSGLARLTPRVQGTFADRYPAWSRDGRQIAFVSFIDHAGGSALERVNTEIYVMQADGTNPRRLTLEQNQKSHPSWSPDGSMLAYAASDGAGHSVIYLLPPDGSADPRAVTDGVGYGDTLDWSPDGQWIAFSSSRDAEADNVNHTALYRIRPDGSGLERISTDEMWSMFWWSDSPSWSPDGKWLAFVGTLGIGQGEDIYIMRLDGSDLRCLTCKAK